MTNINQHISVAARRSPIPPMAFVLTGCIGVIGSNSLGLGPIAPEVARSLGADVPAVMTASAAFGLGTAASAFFLGRLIDRFGARRMLQAALLALTLGLGVSAAAPALWMLIAGQLVAGLAAGVALPSIYALATIIAPAGRESETVGIVLTGWTLSMVAGVSLAAIVADLAGWRFVYLAVTAATLVASMAIASSSIDDGPAEANPSSPFSALRVPGTVRLLAACALFMAGFYGVYGYIGSHLHDGLSLALSANGLLALCYGLGFGGAVFLDPVIDRLGAKRLLPAIFLAVACAYGAMALAAGSFMALLAVVFLWGLANHFGLNVLIMRLTSLDPARRGAIMGLNSGVTYLALFAGTTGFGFLDQAFGFVVLPVAAGTLMLFAVVAAR